MQNNEVSEALEFYGTHPVEFLHDLVGVTLDPWQAEALTTLEREHFLAIRSGSGPGKTFTLSCGLAWFLSTKPFSKVPATAPTQHQLFDLLWSECYKLISGSPYLSSILNWTQTRIGVKGYEASWYAVARTASPSSGSSEISEGLSGFHSEDNLLFIIDEASGLPEIAVPAIEGAFSSENSYCLIGSNPTRREGYFYDIFHKPKTGKRFAKMHVSCMDSPRVTKQYIEVMRERYGEDHPIFLIKVKGEFADADNNCLIPFEFIEKMQNNSKEILSSPVMPIEIGVDVGRSRAASVAYIRQGYNILGWEEKVRARGGTTHAHDFEQWVIGLINDWKPNVVRIDATGIGGPSCDHLQLIYGDLIVPVINAAKANNNDRYLNLRAEGYWTFRDLVPKLWCEKWSERVISQMADIKQRFSKNGKFHVETKEEMLIRAKKSPDDLDALVLAFMENADLNIPDVRSMFSNKISAANSELVQENPWGMLSRTSFKKKRAWA